MYGALLGMAGAGLGVVGAQQQKHAMKRAGRAYDRDLDAYYNREGAANKELQGRYENVSDRRLGHIGTTLDDYMAPSYGVQPGDTAIIDDALAKFSRGNPGAGGTGAASGWGARVAEQTNEATGRQRQIAGDASMLRRIGDQQSGALSDMGVQDQRFGREIGNIQAEESVRRADLARQLNALNIAGQKRFDQASRAGRDWMTVGSLVGAGGQMIDGWNATQPTGGQQAQFDTGYGGSGQNSFVNARGQNVYFR